MKRTGSAERSSSPSGHKSSRAFKFPLRQVASLIFAFTLAWDVHKDWTSIETFGVWGLALHFIYMQLPLKSLALAWFHCVSFSGAFVIPCMYLYNLWRNPRLEIARAQRHEHDMHFSTVVVRSLLIYCLPLVIHVLDVYVNYTILGSAYRHWSSSRFMRIWTCVGFALFGLVYEFSYPDAGGEIEGLPLEYHSSSKLVGLCALLCSLAILYSLFLK